MIAVRQPDINPPVELGFDADYVASAKALWVTTIAGGSPAARMGMKRGDLIVAIDTEPLSDADYQSRIWMRHKPGDQIRLTIERPGEKALITMTGAFRKPAALAAKSFGENLAGQLRGSFPIPFVVVGLIVLFLRIDDPIVWVLALMFAAFTAVPHLAPITLFVPGWLNPWILGYKAVSMGLLGPVFYWFFTVFPRRSPLEQNAPWLKWAAMASALPFVFPPYNSGVPALPAFVLPPASVLAQGIRVIFILGWVVVGLIALALNYFFALKDNDARRKLRIIFWGTVVGVVPSAAEQAYEGFARRDGPNWLVTALIIVVFLFPLSFAYAVVVDHALEIPVLLKRSARYLLVQRGFTFLLSVVSIALTLVFASSLNTHADGQVSQSSAVALGAVFGTALLWGGTQIHRQVSGRIDRAFFRGAYDARRILQDLAEEIRTVTDRAQLAELLERQIRTALQPRSVAIRFGGEHAAAPKLPGTEYVAPMLGRQDNLLGVIALGERLSEEPYSNEDKRLVASVASQAATALENFRLAEEIAARMESERRSAREMEIARDVQARLLPQTSPQLRTIECAGKCIQARSVGGDYFDFLQLDKDHLALVLADVSGKGVHAALLVANLQAYLRSQTGTGVLDPAQSLRVVNRMLWSTTAAQHYATLFYSVYDDANQRLRYVNCGHNPPILLRSDGTVERLPATALVIGLFEKWDCSIAEVQLSPGDQLAIYSDGVTEAARDEEEFGEERFVALLKAHQAKPVDEMTDLLLDEIQQFCGGVMADDMTVLVARAGYRTRLGD